MHDYFDGQKFPKILFYFTDAWPDEAINLDHEFSKIPIVITEDLECIHTFFLFAKNVKWKHSRQVIIMKTLCSASVAAKTCLSILKGCRILYKRCECKVEKKVDFNSMPSLA